MKNPKVGQKIMVYDTRLGEPKKAEVMHVEQDGEILVSISENRGCIYVFPQQLRKIKTPKENDNDI